MGITPHKNYQNDDIFSDPWFENAIYQKYYYMKHLYFPINMDNSIYIFNSIRYNTISRENQL